MWPFKKKQKESKPLPPIPTPEPIPAFSAIEIRLNNVMSEDPDILARLWQARPDEVVVNFPEVGNATAGVIFNDDVSVNGINVRRMSFLWDAWIDHDKHESDRGYANPVSTTLSTGGTAVEITLPTTMAEVLYRGLIFPLGDFDLIVVRPNAALDEDATREIWQNLSNLPSVDVGIGSQVHTAEGVRSPQLYNATGTTPSRKAIGRMNRNAFKVWLRDPWGRYRAENPPKPRITSPR